MPGEGPAVLVGHHPLRERVGDGALQLPDPLPADGEPFAQVLELHRLVGEHPLPGDHERALVPAADQSRERGERLGHQRGGGRRNRIVEDVRLLGLRGRFVVEGLTRRRKFRALGQLPGRLLDGRGDRHHRHRHQLWLRRVLGLLLQPLEHGERGTHLGRCVRRQPPGDHGHGVPYACSLALLPRYAALVQPVEDRAEHRREHPVPVHDPGPGLSGDLRHRLPRLGTRGTEQSQYGNHVPELHVRPQGPQRLRHLVAERFGADDALDLHERCCVPPTERQPYVFQPGGQELRIGVADGGQEIGQGGGGVRSGGCHGRATLQRRGQAATVGD